MIRKGRIDQEHRIVLLESEYPFRMQLMGCLYRYAWDIEFLELHTYMSANTVITPQGIPDTEDQHGWL